MENHPKGVSISLTVRDGAAALDFYARAFGAGEVCRMAGPSGGVAHAEMTIGPTTVYLSEEAPEFHAVALPTDRLSSASFTILVDDCDAAHTRAVEAGAKSLVEPIDEFWGMRHALVADPFGFRWYLGQVIEQLSHEEVAARAAKLMK